MDAVNAFNQELFSLMEMKPPISRAKMILITKAAIKAIKLYKHVVQIVEKFIKKCKPEFKVAGLYVIDSIVRQSRHQFGIDKDVFGPRFTKNITATFQCLYLCPSEDKSKIVRVLNLWQKNGVFKIEIIQPLLDMAAGASVTVPVPENSNDDVCETSHLDHQMPVVEPNVISNEGSPPPPSNIQVEPPEVDDNSIPTASQLPNSDAFAAVAQLFQTTQGQQLQQILQNFQQPPPKPQSPVLDDDMLAAQVQAITAQLNTTSQPQEQKMTFDKKLLDRFDYDDEPDTADDIKKEISTLSPAPPQPPFGFSGDGMPPPVYPQLPVQLPNMDQFQQGIMGILPDPLHNQAPLPPPPPPPPNGQMAGFGLLPTPPYPPMVPPMVAPTPPIPQPFQAPFPTQSETHIQKVHQQQEMSMEIEQPSVQEVKHVTDGKKSRSRSASRSPKRRRSRSGSRSRRSRHRRSRSRSRDRRRHSPRSRSHERREREKERERRQKGLPPIKSEIVSVCSTTLWVGQLDKRTTQQDVGSLLEEFGPIESINMIPPRGCAYIVMVNRQDAFRALQKLSRGNYKVNQKSIKIAWALNKGIKADYKQYWDVELGVTYVPWDKIKPEELESFCEGGVLDNDTLSPEWKIIPKKPEKKEVAQNGGAENVHPEEAPPVPLPLQIPVPVPVPLHAPMPGPIPAHPPGPPIGALQPPLAFSPHLSMPPPGFAPGVPPPPPPPFMRPGFNPLHLPPGFLPPGPPPPLVPPVSLPPTPGINILTSTSTNVTDNTSKDMSLGSPIPTVVTGPRGNAESGDSMKIFGSGPPPMGPGGHPGPANHPGPGGHPGPANHPGPGGHPGPANHPGPGSHPGLANHPGPGSHPGLANHPGPVNHPGPGGHPGPAGHPGHSGHPGPGSHPGQGGHPGPSGHLGQGGHPGPGGHPGQGGHPGPGSHPGQGGHPGPGGHPGQGGHPGPGGHPGQSGHPGPGGHPRSGGHPGSGGHSGPASHSGPGSHSGPTSHSGPGGHSGPASHSGPGGHSGPASHSGPGGHSGPASHSGPGGHSGPAGHPGPGGHPGPSNRPGGHPSPGGHPGPINHPGPGGHTGPSSHPAPVNAPVPLLGIHPQAGGAPNSVPGLQPPSTGLLGARPGLIPLQRPPGVPPPHLQRFPLMPPRSMPPHMGHRGPPPGPGGYGMPPPHGIRGQFPPHGHFVRPGGSGGHGGSGGPEEREGRQFRNERQMFNPGRDHERFGRRSFGNRIENDRDRFSNRHDERDHDWPGGRDHDWPGGRDHDWPGGRDHDWPGGRDHDWPDGRDHDWPGGRDHDWPGGRDHDWPGGRDHDWPGGRDHDWPGGCERREWGRRTPERDRHWDTEERNRRFSGYRDRNQEPRDRETQREKEENREKEKPEVTDGENSEKNHESPRGRVGNTDIVSELNKRESESKAPKPAEESPSVATSAAKHPEKDSGSFVEAPR
uniref:SR-related and CTD-associated factor 4 isoform X2 n=1 Tax=Geotrypetes seraphini TaxID=260995 RepID=A0A6P8RAD4_GEOSA|nr:SR-related and CTD-associated factor 4 isoform X2 [Geotrypetes seraphini]